MFNRGLRAKEYLSYSIHAIKLLFVRAVLLLDINRIFTDVVHTCEYVDNFVNNSWFALVDNM